jgi:hypothetical protein
MMVDLLADWESNWGIIAMLSVLVLFFIEIIHYMFAKMFMDQRGQTIAMAEIIDNIAIALIIIFLVFIVNGISVVLTPQEYRQPINILAIEQSKEQTLLMLAETEDVIRSAASDARWVLPLSSTYIGLMGIPVFQGSWFGGIYRRVSEVQFLTQKGTELAVFLSAEYYVLDYISKYMLSLFLPIGIVLRAMKLTRGLGALLISISIALYYIYPSILWFASTGFVAPPKSPMIETETVCNYPTYLSIGRGFDLDFSSFSMQSVQMGIRHKSMQEFITSVFYQLLLGNLAALSLAFVFIRFATVILGGMPTAFISMVSKFV